MSYTLNRFEYNSGGEIHLTYADETGHPISNAYRLPMAEDDNFYDSVICIEEQALVMSPVGKVVPTGFYLKIFDPDIKEAIEIIHAGRHHKLETFIDNWLTNTSDPIVSVQMIKMKIR